MSLIKKWFPPAPQARTASPDLVFEPIEPRTCVRNGITYLVDGFLLDRAGRRAFARAWSQPRGVPLAELAPVDGKGPL